MTIEYVLLLIAVFFVGLKFFMTAPADAFRNSGPRLAARVEQQLATGNGFVDKAKYVSWEGK